MLKDGPWEIAITPRETSALLGAYNIDQSSAETLYLSNQVVLHLPAIDIGASGCARRCHLEPITSISTTRGGFVSQQYYFMSRINHHYPSANVQQLLTTSL